jgi:tetratricopeptide (TPR) repeat protein
MCFPAKARKYSEYNLRLVGTPVMTYAVVNMFFLVNSKRAYITKRTGKTGEEWKKDMGRIVNWFLRQTIVSSLMLSASLVSPSHAQDGQFEKIEKQIHAAEAYYRFGLAEHGERRSFLKGLILLKNAEGLLNKVPAKQQPPDKTAAILSTIEVLRQDILLQDEIAKNTLFGTFPLVRFFGSTLFVDPKATSTYKLVGNSEAAAIMTASEKLLLKIKSRLTKIPSHVVAFTSSPENRTLENKARHAFGALGKVSVVARQHVVTALRKQALSTKQAKAWIEEYDTGEISEKLLDVLTEAFGVNTLVLIMLKKVDLEPGDNYFKLNGKILSRGVGQHVFSASTIGLSRDRSDLFVPVLTLHVAFCIIAVGLFLAIRFWHEGVSYWRRNLVKSISTSAGYFVFGRVIPWIFLPPARSIMPEPESLVILSFWWVVLVTFSLFVIPVIFVRALNSRVQGFFPAVSIDNRFGEVSLAVAIGTVSYIATPILLYHGTSSLPPIFALAGCLAITAYLLGRALDTRQSLPIELAIFPVTGMVVTGLAVASASIPLMFGVGAVAAISSSFVLLIYEKQKSEPSRITAEDNDSYDDRDGSELQPKDFDALQKNITSPPYQSFQPYKNAFQQFQKIMDKKTCWLGIIGGEGTGKTATSEKLVQSIASNTSSGSVIVLRGQCRPSGSDNTSIPFGPIQEALGGYLGTDLTGEEADKDLQKAVDAAYNMLIGPLGMFFNSVTEGTTQKLLSDADLYNSIEKKLRDLCNKFLVILVIDDIQWIDKASSELLCHLHNTMPVDGNLQFGILLASRNEDSIRAFMEQGGPDSFIRLDLLRDEEQSKFLSTCFGAAPPTINWIKQWLEEQESKGIAPRDLVDTINLLFRHKYLILANDGFRMTTAEPDIPNGDEEEIRKILDASDLDRELLTAAACLGKEFEVSLLSQALGRPEITVLNRLYELERDTGLFFDRYEKDDIFHFRSQRALDAVRRVVIIHFSGPGSTKIPQFIRFMHGAIGKSINLIDNQSFASFQRSASHFYAAGNSYANEAIVASLRASKAARSMLRFDQARKNIEQAKEYLPVTGSMPAVLHEELLLEEARASATGLIGSRTAAAEALLKHFEEDVCSLGVSAARACYETAIHDAPGEEKQAWFEKCVGIASEIIKNNCSVEIQVEALQFMALGKPPAQREDRIQLLRDALAKSEKEHNGTMLGLQARIKNSLAEELIYVKEASARTESLKLFQESIKIKEMEGITDQAGLARSFGGLGRLYFFEMKDYEKAVQNFQKDLDISLEIGDRTGISKMHSFIGQCQMNLKNAPLARNHFRECIGLNQDLIDIYMSFQGLLKIATNEDNTNAVLSLSEEIRKRADVTKIPDFAKAGLKEILVGQSSAGNENISELLKLLSR